MLAKRLKTAVTISVLASIVFGCADGTLELGNSPFESGIYTGQDTCTTTISIEAVIVESLTETDFDATVTISGSGLPTYEGQEVAPGVSISTDFAAFELLLAVTNVTIANNGVLVGGDITIDFDFGDAGTIRTQGVFQDDYLLGQQASIITVSDTTVIGRRSDGSIIVMEINCNGEFEM